MSFFISAMPADGLMSRPPVSKQTPLPINVTFGCVGSPQTKSTSRGRARGGLPHGVDGRESALQFVAHDFLRGRTVLARDPDRLGGKPLGRHVGRRRVDEIARKRRCTRESQDVGVVDG